MALTIILTRVGVVHVKCISEVCLQAFTAEVAFCYGFELYPVFCHYDQLWNKLFSHQFFLRLQPSQEHLHCIFSSVPPPGGVLLHLEVQPLPFYIPFFFQKRHPFRIPFIGKRHPFHISVVGVKSISVKFRPSSSS